MSNADSKQNERQDRTLTSVILVADDDLVMQQSVADLLRISGYQVLTAANGALALQVLQSQTPDLIIADIAMPEMDGYELYDAVRSNPEWNLLPFIFLSARGEQKDIRYGYRLGADHYLTKPFEPEDLLAIVQAHLSRMNTVRATVTSNIDTMKRRLLNTFSHELRTPLTAIYGFVGLLQDDLDALSDDQVKEMLGHIENGAKRLNHLVEDMLLLLQIDSGAVKIEMARFSQPVDVGQVINNVVLNLGSQADYRHVEIETRIPERMTVMGIPSYLIDMLARLVDNAIKFSQPNDGGVVISANRRDDQVHIAVEDRGIGISMDQQKRLFQRFEQINRERMEQQGAGLGLVIAMGLANLHGGTIIVESQETIGSTFTLVLPAAD
jgi:signal transduction histidine kinase